MQDFTFKKMLKIVEPFGSPKDEHLDDLAKHMVKPTRTESKKIPAGYTYFGQFVDHDISLDSKSRIYPWQPVDLSDIVNKRVPAFDLETVYGIDIEPDEKNPVVRKHLREAGTPFLKLGKTSFRLDTKVKRSFDHDLPRHLQSTEAILVDGRNDENLLVAQTHVAFIKFHNAIALNLSGSVDARFEEARRKTIRYYQHIVRFDFLPKIIKKTVLDDIIANGCPHYDPKNNGMFVPVEYSVAAYRMGHSMVRSRYNINSLHAGTHLNMLTVFTGSRSGSGSPSMMGLESLPSDWIIDWNLFYNIDDSKNRFSNTFNFAFKINTQISRALGNIGMFSDFRKNSIPALDLYRGRLFELPPGQLVAKTLTGQADRLPSAEIKKLLPQGVRDIFDVDTPLWFYILAEAEIEANSNGGSGAETEIDPMGEVGSRLVGETFIALLRESEASILREPLTSVEKAFVGVENDGYFGMPEMLKFIEKVNNPTNNPPGLFLNPVGTVQI
jgi:hypothetical protein